MNLTVRDVAKWFNTSERSVYRWIEQGLLPAYKVNEQYRFNRAELLEWATARRMHVSAEILAEPEGNGEPCTIIEALREGGIHYRIGGNDKPAILRAMVDQIPVPAGVDRDWMYEMLLARESLGSTAIGNGIAIPHVRYPIVLNGSRPVVALCFLEHPIEFGALDRKPVGILFTVISPSIRAHLHVLSRLGFILRDPRVTAVLARVGTREEIFREVERAEAPLSNGRTAGRDAAECHTSPR